jgi:hypothetical protein
MKRNSFFFFFYITLSRVVYRKVITIIFITSIADAQLNLRNDLKSKLTFSTPAPLVIPTFSANPLLQQQMAPEGSATCQCAVFMSGQFKKGSTEPPKGYPAITQETDIAYPCTSSGTKMCINKCLETIVKHLPNSPAIICGTIDRDCHREKAYLFVKNCDAKQWINSNLSAGREYCCKTGEPVNCLSL